MHKSNDWQIYFGLSETRLKGRYTNNNKSKRNKPSNKETGISKYIYLLKQQLKCIYCNDFVYELQKFLVMLLFEY